MLLIAGEPLTRRLPVTAANKQQRQSKNSHLTHRHAPPAILNAAYIHSGGSATDASLGKVNRSTIVNLGVSNDGRATLARRVQHNFSRNGRKIDAMSPFNEPPVYGFLLSPHDDATIHIGAIWKIGPRIENDAPFVLIKHKPAGLYLHRIQLLGVNNDPGNRYAA
ncbi:hypothetical protein G6F40_015439 [Rhizopus arrhizus]|nr:hypothetical protein G6F40_015439 [Rhizopus arrhizus]